MKKQVFLGAMTISLFSCVSAFGQQAPAAQVVQSIDCRLNDGASIAQAAAVMKSQSRDATSASAIFLREAIFHNNFRAEYDFRIAQYYPTYAVMEARVSARRDRPDVRMRSGARGSDVFTCDTSTLNLAIVRAIPDNDGFSGDATNMMTRFCTLNEGSSVADAFQFASGVAANMREAGDNSLMQVGTRSVGPAGATGASVVAGRHVVISTIPATSANWAKRMDMFTSGMDPRVGLDSPMQCNYPAMWRTHAIYRAGN